MERMKPPGRAALQVSSSESQGLADVVHLFNSLTASGLQPENCSSPTRHRASPLHSH